MHPLPLQVPGIAGAAKGGTPCLCLGNFQSRKMILKACQQRVFGVPFDPQDRAALSFVAIGATDRRSDQDQAASEVLPTRC